jgi:hypothetical protein
MRSPARLGSQTHVVLLAAVFRFPRCNAAPSTVKLTLPAPAGGRILLALAAASLTITALLPASAQQANTYAQQPYGYSGYGSSSAAPSSAYAQPQYAQPSYAQPQAQQPQYGQDYGQFPGDENQNQQFLGATPAQPQALSAAQLEQLLAPVALYPDQLLAEVLTAATYPAQVAAADQWLTSMRAQGYGSDQIAAGADAETGWDPSIKALTAFPDVLDTLNRNLSWTTELGNAYYNQPQDVMQTVQVLRERAQTAGNLQTTPQETVTNDQSYVGIQPANPEVVYVPVYNPWVVYGSPFTPYPGFSFFGALANFFGMGIESGPGFAMAAFDRTPFGLLAWALDWLGNSVLFHHNNYWTSSNSVNDWGLPHGGRRYRAGPEINRAGANSYRSGTGYRIGMNWNRSNSNRPANSYTRASQAEYARSAPARSWNDRNSPQSPAPYRGSSQPGQSYAARPGQNLAPQAYAARPYATRPGFSYANPSRANPSPVYRNAAPQAARGFTESRSFPSFGAQQRSTGFTGREMKSFAAAPKNFGGGRAPKFDGGKMPKGFGGGKAPKGFGGGKAPKAPKASHESGHHHGRFR